MGRLQGEREVDAAAHQRTGGAGGRSEQRPAGREGSSGVRVPTGRPAARHGRRIGDHRRERRCPDGLLPGRSARRLRVVLLPRQGPRRSRDAGPGRCRQPLRSRAPGREGDEVLSPVPVEPGRLREPRSAGHDAPSEVDLARRRRRRPQHPGVDHPRARQRSLLRRRRDRSRRSSTSTTRTAPSFGTSSPPTCRRTRSAWTSEAMGRCTTPS